LRPSRGENSAFDAGRGRAGVRELAGLTRLPDPWLYGPLMVFQKTIHVTDQEWLPYSRNIPHSRSMPGVCGSLRGSTSQQLEDPQREGQPPPQIGFSCILCTSNRSLPVRIAVLNRLRSALSPKTSTNIGQTQPNNGRISGSRQKHQVCQLDMLVLQSGGLTYAGAALYQTGENFTKSIEAS
jgi:hypothetical protein